MKFIQLIMFGIVFVACQACTQKPSPEQTLKQAVEWIWSQQSDDGGWHSITHAVLRDGRVLTPYILYHLLQLDSQYQKPSSIYKGVGFIIDEMRAAIDDSTSTLSDYPNYSAAYALRVLNSTERDTQLQNIIIRYLLDQQFIEHRGFDTTHLAYGGWGYGETKLPFGQHGHVDISHTRRITEALRECGSLNAKKNIESIRLYLKGVQRATDDPRLYEGCVDRSRIPYDGGFIASTVTISTIKSEPVLIPSAGYHYPSYATATCDGFMTLHALGDEGTQSYEDAKNWLLQNQDMKTIDGLSLDDPEQWAEVMHYYHLAVRAEVMNLIQPGGAWRDAIMEILIKEQTPEGYFFNPIGGVNKEDDPLMATIFAIQAASVVQ